MKDKEKLAKQIQAEYERDGEPISFADALEVAEMEIKAGGVRHYEQSTSTKAERKPPTRQPNPTKQMFIDLLYKSLTVSGVDLHQLAITNIEKSIDFVYQNKSYTVSLTEHRPPK